MRSAQDCFASILVYKHTLVCICPDPVIHAELLCGQGADVRYGGGMER